jgi:hypothetical protein
MNDPLRIPRCVLLKGAGRNLTELYWRDTAEPFESLIYASNSFGIEDLTIMAANHRSGILADDGDKPDAGNVTLRRLHLHLNRYEQLQSAQAAERFLPMPWEHAIAVGFGGRGPGANVWNDTCDEYLKAGGWCSPHRMDNNIPCRNVYIFNNVLGPARPATGHRRRVGCGGWTLFSFDWKPQATPLPGERQRLLPVGAPNSQVRDGCKERNRCQLAFYAAPRSRRRAKQSFGGCLAIRISSG